MRSNASSSSSQSRYSGTPGTTVRPTKTSPSVCATHAAAPAVLLPVPPGPNHVFATSAISYASINRHVDIDAAINQAFAVGRAGDPIAQLMAVMQTAVAGTSIEPTVVFDEAALTQRVNQVAAVVDSGAPDGIPEAGMALECFLASYDFSFFFFCLIKKRFQLRSRIFYYGFEFFFF